MLEEGKLISRLYSFNVLKRQNFLEKENQSCHILLDKMQNDSGATVCWFGISSFSFAGIDYSDITAL